VTLTLWGAYHRLVRPLEQRSLAVHIALDRSVDPAAIVEAEGLVTRAGARIEASRTGATIAYRLLFSDERGDPWRLDLVQHLEGRTLRTWTELAGTLRSDDRAPWGSARLRVDYRDVSLRALLDAFRTIERIIH
jgi:hypothetical protein